MDDGSVDFTDIESVWKYTASHLEKSGIGVTLVGGGVASIYSGGSYVSGDLDFVSDKLFAPHGEIDRAMGEIGFVKTKVRMLYQREGCIFLVEFMSTPILIGDQVHERIEPDRIEVSEGVSLKILSPVDCVKDRIFKFACYNDRDSIMAAVDVALNKFTSSEIESVRKWCSLERIDEQFKEFLKSYESASRDRK